MNVQIPQGLLQEKLKDLVGDDGDLQLLEQWISKLLLQNIQA